MARRHNAGDKSPVAAKQTTREEPGAHPEHVEDDERAEGTTQRRVDGHSDHGGASNGDGGASVAVMDEMTKKQGIKHHGNKAKLELRCAEAKAHRRALATAKRDHRRCCRP